MQQGYCFLGGVSDTRREEEKFVPLANLGEKRSKSSEIQLNKVNNRRGDFFQKRPSKNASKKDATFFGMYRKLIG